MEKTVVEKLGIEALPLERMRHFEKALAEVKGKPKPSGESFGAWEEREKKKCEEEMALMADSLCATSYKEIEVTYSAENWVEVLLKKFGAEPVKLSTPAVRLAYLPLFRKFLEEHSEKMMLGRFEQEVKDVERKIGEWKLKSPKSFSPEKINTDPRFPIDRVGFEGERPVDKWLVEGLKSKTPIFFLPHDEWLKNLLRFWDQVVRPMELEKARKAEIQAPPQVVRPVVEEQLKPEPKPSQKMTIPITPMQELHRIDAEREAGEQFQTELNRQAGVGTRGGIYGGRRR